MHRGVDRLGLPVADGAQAFDQRSEYGRGLRREVLGGVLLVVGLDPGVEELRLLGHLQQGPAALALLHDHVHERGAVRRVHALTAQMPVELRRDHGRIGALQVLVADPVGLLHVEARGRGADVIEVELGDHLLAREQLLVAMAPTEAHEGVEDRVRREAHRAVFHDAQRAMTLAELGTVAAEDHRHVRVLRRGCAQRLQDVDLPRRVVDVVVAADDVGDAHVHVVDDDAEVVGRHAVAAGDDEVVQLVAGEDDPALDEVVEHHLAVLRVPEPHHGLHACGRRRQHLARLGAPAAVVARLFLARLLLGAHRIKLFLARVTVGGRAGREHLLDHLGVAVETLGLIDLREVAREPEPLHALEDRIHRRLGAALAIGVLDAQQVLAAEALGIQIRKQRRACAADVQEAGGRRGEAGDDGHDGRATRRGRAV